VAGDLDVALPDDVSDDAYCAELSESLRLVEARLAGQHGEAVPPGAGGGAEAEAGGRRGPPPWCQLLFFQAGVDPLKEDRLGNLSLSREGLQRRNAIVMEFCRRHAIPCVITMGGGYSRPIDATAQAHVDVFAEAARTCRAIQLAR
jgi:acetoin utilization deacetylase AcuC-like enzyme